MYDIPILLIVFNRPSTTRKMFDCIIELQPNKLYVSADGPRNIEEAVRCNEVRKITEENYNKYKEQINPNNHPRTLCGIENGYQLDHRVSIKWGFLHGVNPKVIGNVDNLQMLPWKENLTKGV